MMQILLATHGKMASGMKYTAELIVGQVAEITTIDAYVNPDDDIEAAFDNYFKQHEQDRIVIFTDLMGGSVNQKLMKYRVPDKITLITGSNLPVLINTMLAPDTVTDQELLEYIEESRGELKLVQPEGLEDGQKAQASTTKEASKTSPKVVEHYENSTAHVAALRIDDRLIHGQVAMTWTKQLKVNGIVVANDDAAADNTQKMALKMAVPAGIKSLIKPVDDAIRILNDPRAKNMRILVLTRTVKDALRIRKEVGQIDFLNLGNTGRFDGIDVSEKLQLTPTIMLTDAELECLKELAALDPKLCMQQVPNDEARLVKDVIEKL